MNNIEIIRSGRKTVALEIQKDLRVIVRAPLKMEEKDIERFVAEKSDWLEKHLKIAKQRLEDEKKNASLPGFTYEEISALADKAVQAIPLRVEYYAELMNVDYGRITVRNQVSRWGSCSSKGNLNFNCLLMLCPPEVLDYVVVHELCHLKQMNHSPAFWAEVAAILPKYELQKKWLKENGNALIKRLRRG